MTSTPVAPVATIAPIPATAQPFALRLGLDPGNVAHVELVAFARDKADAFAWAQRDWTVGAWSRTPLRSWTKRAPGQVKELRWLDGGAVAAVTHTATIVWDAFGKESLRIYGDEHTAARTLGSMRLSHPGGRLAFLSNAEQGTLDVIDLASGARASRIETHARDVERIDWVDRDRAIALWAGSGLSVFDVATGKLSRSCSTCRLGRGPDLTLSPDGARVSPTASWGPLPIQSFDLRTVAEARCPPSAGSRVSSVAWSTRGGRALTTCEGSPNEVISLYDTSSWSVLATQALPPASRADVTFTDDASSIIVVDRSPLPSLAILDAATLRPKSRIDVGLGALFVSPDGRIVAQASRGALTVRDTSLGRVLARFSGQEDDTARFDDVAFAGDAVAAVRRAGASDRSLFVWRPRRTEASSTIDASLALRAPQRALAPFADLAHDPIVRDIAPSPDGRLVAVSREDRVDILDASDRSRIGSAPISASGSSWTNDGRILILLVWSSEDVAFYDVRERTELGRIRVSLSILNRQTLIDRDLAAIVTPELASHPSALAKLVAIEDGAAGALAIRHDGAFVAFATNRVELRRTSDDARLYLWGLEVGDRALLASDQAAFFDGDDAAVARVRIEASATGDIVSGAMVERFRRQGLFEAFEAGR